MRFLFPLVLIAAAVTVFTLYTNPQYQQVKAVKAEVTQYDDALTKSLELKKLRDQLISRRNTFESADIQKLEKILPDNVDNIRLVIDIDSIASRHGLKLKNVELGSLSDAAAARSTSAVGGSGSAIGSVELEFTVTATYEKMMEFLIDLEHSLRVLDVEKIDFKVNDIGDVNDYTFLIRTYWLH